jgi:hypothetical protein
MRLLAITVEACDAFNTELAPEQQEVLTDEQTSDLLALNRMRQIRAECDSDPEFFRAWRESFSLLYKLEEEEARLAADQDRSQPGPPGPKKARPGTK